MNSDLIKYAKLHEGFMNIWEILHAGNLLSENVIALIIKLFNHKNQPTCFSVTSYSANIENYYRSFDIRVNKGKLTVIHEENSLTFNLKSVKLYKHGVFHFKGNIKLRIY
jgi:hypothetical protein